MDKSEFRDKRKQLIDLLLRYKYVLVVILAGIVFLLIPPTTNTKEEVISAKEIEEEDFSVEALESKLEDTLAEIDGAGRVRVMLTVQSGMKRVFAQDGKVEQEGGGVHRESQIVVVSSGSGGEETVLVQQIYPQFQGALVVADGGGDPSIRLKLTEAVAALTGLGADKISICKGK